MNIQRRRFRRVFLSATALACALYVSPALAGTGSNPWGVPYTDVTPDPSIRFGKLPNGMKYAIRRNATPKGTASVRFNFAFGSIAESEKERGLAHFIEHLAFNGSTHVPEGDMIRILQRQGLAFGPDTNASTGFEDTTYMLDLPKTDNERIDTALFLMREVASELKIDQGAVDRERGVVLSERRARDNYQLKRALQGMQFQYPLTPYPNRFPIGTDEVLKTATADTIRDLYRRYYRPENATLIFVGDADPAIIERKIRAKFSDWQPQGPAGAKLDRGRVDLTRPAAVDVFTDPAVETSVALMVMTPWEDPADTRWNRRRQLIQGAAMSLLARRLQEISNRPDSKLIGASAGRSPSRDLGYTASISAAAKDGQWKDALQVAEQELRRALKFGFTASELKVQMSETEGALKRSAERSSTRSNQELANAILAIVEENDFITTPEFRYAFYRETAPSITLDEVNAEFRRLWAGSKPLVFVTDKSAVDKAEVTAALETSRQVAVAAPVDGGDLQFAYQDFGTPGKIVADKTITDLGIRTIRFANNVRLNLKKTDFENGSVRYSVRIAGGMLALPADKPGLPMLINSVFALAGLEKHSIEDLRKITAGHNVQPGLAVAEDALAVQGGTSTEDLPLQLQLTAAYVTAPGYRPEAANRWAGVLPVLEGQRRATAQNVSSFEVPRIIADGDPRFGVPSNEVLTQRTLDEAKAALQPLLQSAPIEIGIVGDFVDAQVIEAVAKTFGALPARDAAAPAYTEQRKARVRRDTTPVTLTHRGTEDQAMVTDVWPATDDDDYQRFVGLDVLTDVLNIMLTETLREELGDTYSPSVGVNASDTFDDFGYIAVGATVAPDKIGAVEDAIRQAVAKLRDAPVDADLLTRARNPTLQRIDRSRRDNGFWLDRVAVAQTEPEDIERIRKQRATYLSVTPAQLQQLARQYMPADREVSIRIVSDKAKLAAT
ncbi:insulinase family protein [Sphingomonas piscis]|uniref:Insulinase family protein n=1 Tax=Sphingomonas piscis TaxID=2714943 RepID=A0A6G7YRV8_9SPHN|nr:insulinase family protein [Sphingomonas piscis]QIK79476.1 insulinase family protein [Sphingomonas piscis]